MQTCVTGGTGFVGSHIVRVLLEDGHPVRVLHRQNSKLDALQGLDYESAIGDVTDYEAMLRAFEGCDWVFHVAAVADYWRANRDWMFEVNVEGTRKVLQAAKAVGVKRVIFTSSAAAVGMSENGIPSDETITFNLSPEKFPYGYSKILAEDLVQEATQAGQDVVILNPAVVIGPGDLNMISGSYITQVVSWQWLVPKTSGGIGVIDVRDVAMSHLAAAKKGRTGERYLLNTKNFTNQAWFGLIAEIVGVAPALFPVADFMLPHIANIVTMLQKWGIETPVDANQTRLGGRMIYWDASKAYQELHQPQIDMRQSVQDTYDWYVEYSYIQASMMATMLRKMSYLWHRP
jgi:dihydroflavonol-4-reductase